MVEVHLRMPADIAAQVHVLTFSAARGYSPRGAISEFYANAVRRELDRIKQETQSEQRTQGED